jgi:hypothetical protein
MVLKVQLTLLWPKAMRCLEERLAHLIDDDGTNRLAPFWRRKYDKVERSHGRSRPFLQHTRERWLTPPE